MGRSVEMSHNFVEIPCADVAEEERIAELLKKNRRLLNELFNAELGHDCHISDGEMVIDALESNLSLTTSAVRVLRLKQRQG
jgi:hypothetical protein